MEKPEQLKEIDFTRLREICQEYVDFVDDDEEYHEDNDYEYYIFEAAVEAVFGKDFWSWHNKRQN